MNVGNDTLKSSVSHEAEIIHDDSSTMPDTLNSSSRTLMMEMKLTLRWMFYDVYMYHLAGILTQVSHTHVHECALMYAPAHIHTYTQNTLNN